MDYNLFNIPYFLFCYDNLLNQDIILFCFWSSQLEQSYIRNYWSWQKEFKTPFEKSLQPFCDARTSLKKQCSSNFVDKHFLPTIYILRTMELLIYNIWTKWFKRNTTFAIRRSQTKMPPSILIHMTNSSN